MHRPEPTVFMRKSLIIFSLGLALVQVAVTSVMATPSAPFGTTISGLKDGNPNVTWSLYVVDYALADIGLISNGWSITLTTANPVGFAADNEVLMVPSATNMLVGGTVTFFISVTNYGPSV